MPLFMWSIHRLAIIVALTGGILLANSLGSVTVDRAEAATCSLSVWDPYKSGTSTTNYAVNTFGTVNCGGGNYSTSRCTNLLLYQYYSGGWHIVRDRQTCGYARNRSIHAYVRCTGAQTAYWFQAYLYDWASGQGKWSYQVKRTC